LLRRRSLQEVPLLLVLLATMSPGNEVLQAVPFDATSDAKEPLIATGDAEEEDHGIEERDLCSLKLSFLLLGLIVGVFIQFSTLGANCLAIYFGMKSTTASFISLLWSLFTVAPLFLILEFIRTLGRSEESLEDMTVQLLCQFGHVVVDPFAIMVFGFIWYKVTMASATDSKPSSTRPSMAEQTMMTV
jgi:hypothetical protein